MVKHKRTLRIIFAILVTVGIFILLFQRISFNSVLNTMKNANLKIVILTSLISLISNTLIVSYRWKLILQELNCSISWKEALFIKMGSRILPFKTNEASRVLYLRRLKEIPYSKAIFSVVSEYLLSGLALICFILVGVVFYCCRIKAFSKSSVATYLNYTKFLLLAGIANIDRACRKRFWDRVWGLFRDYSGKFKGLLKNRKIIFISFLYWGFDLLNVYLLSLAVNNPLPLFGILLFMPIVIFAGGIPISVGGLGTREVTLIFLFSSYGSLEILLSISLLYYFIEQLFPNLVSVGFSGMFLNKVIWKDLN